MTGFAKIILSALPTVLALALSASSTQADQTLKVAVAQIPVKQDIAENAATIHRALDVAIRDKADILLTPEGSLSGYTPKFDQAETVKHLAAIVKRASGARVALALGTCFTEPDDKKCYNEIRFYDANGNFAGFHTKTLLCGSLTVPSKGEITITAPARYGRSKSRASPSAA